MDNHQIDYYGLLSLNYHVIDLVNEFLREREGRLVSQLLSVLPIHISVAGNAKLSDAVDGFSKQIRDLAKDRGRHPNKMKHAEIIAKINPYLWDYTELLEGCVAELFQQLKMIGIEQWNHELQTVAVTIKDILVHRIEELTWMIRRFDQLLKEYNDQPVSKNRFYRLFKSSSKDRIDPEICKHLVQTDQMLQIQFESFNEKFQRFQKIDAQVATLLENIKNFSVVQYLDDNEQNFYADLLYLLKFWELSQNSKDNLEVVNTLRNIASIHFILKAYKDYIQNFKTSLFRSSIELKEAYLLDEEIVPEVRQTLKERTVRIQEELEFFLSAMNRHRDFLLKTDPNPYVSSRWGFTEHAVGPEPAKTLEILSLIYKAEEVHRWYSDFYHSIDKMEELRDLLDKQNLIERCLHEMSQPLVSQSYMRRSANQLLNHLNSCNELGTAMISVIAYTEEVLNKALKLDWKYHVMHEIPLFHEIYRIHKGLRREAEEIVHRTRLERFEKLCKKLITWVEKEDWITHGHEMELDMNDIKIYLQDFFATVQRSIKEKPSDEMPLNVLASFKHELMDYRYLFGDFFLKMMNRGSEGQRLRNQLLFVDQYFDSIENSWKDIP